MSRIRYGCQLYTWQMNRERYAGRLAEIADVVRRAGFEGIELETCMLGDYFDRPEALARLLADRGLALASVCLVCDWRAPSETEDEQALADRTIDFATKFGGAVLNLCQMPGADRSDRGERQRNALSCVRAVAGRAAEQGLVSVFHPNSPDGSVFRTETDYGILLAGLDGTPTGFCPDVGHMAKGGVPVLEFLSRHVRTVRHVHFKDIDARNEWRGMGKGRIDFAGVVGLLEASGYDGWIMVEEESAEAELDPDAVTLENGAYVRGLRAGKSGR